MYIFIKYYRLNDYNYFGFFFNLFEEWKDLMRIERRYGVMGIFFELRAVEVF